MGITHHSNYIRFMEEARIDYLEQIGYGFEKLEAEGIVSPVVSLSVNYIHPTTFPDKIQIEVTIGKITSLKISFDYTMTVDGKKICTASSTHCFLRAGRPVVMEKEFPVLFSRLTSQIGDTQQ